MDDFHGSMRSEDGFNIKVQIAHFELSRQPYPLKVRDLPKPEIATTFRPASEDGASRILREFDLAFHRITPQE